jgi:integrase
LIRESSKSSSKVVAREAEQARRRSLELSFNRIPTRRHAPLLSTGIREWLAEKDCLSSASRRAYKERSAPLLTYFGDRLICDIDLECVLRYRNSRLSLGLSNRTVNYEIGCLRGVLKKYGLWSPIGERVHKLRENHNVGKAILREHEDKLLTACAASTSPSILPLFVIARDTGLRASELRALKLKNLSLTWKEGSVQSGELTVPKSKTAAGTGRIVPLSRHVCAALSLWLERLGISDPEAYLFPRHRIEVVQGANRMVDIDRSRAMTSWQRAWRTILRDCGVHYRWHDLRHTFITRLAENPTVSEQTIRSLAGHVSREMLDRYSHIRSRAKREAIAAIENLGREGTKEGTNHPRHAPSSF